MADSELTALYRLQISTCTGKGWLVSLLISADAGAGFCSGTSLRSLCITFCLTFLFLRERLCYESEAVHSSRDEVPSTEHKQERFSLTFSVGGRFTFK